MACPHLQHICVRLYYSKLSAHQYDRLVPFASFKCGVHSYQWLGSENLCSFCSCEYCDLHKFCLQPSLVCRSHYKELECARLVRKLLPFNPLLITSTLLHHNGCLPGALSAPYYQICCILLAHNLQDQMIVLLSFPSKTEREGVSMLTPLCSYEDQIFSHFLRSRA